MAVRISLRWAWLIPVILGAGLFLTSRYPDAAHRKAQVLILSTPLDDGRTDVGPGLGTLLGDHLEVLAGAAVLHASTLPEGEALRRLPPNLHILRFHARREGDFLALAPAWTTPARLLAGAPWATAEFPPLEPWEALEAWVRGWPLAGANRVPPGRLVPQSPLSFWSLVEAMSIRSDHEAAAHLEASQRLAEQEPGCATAWATLGDHLYRSLWVNPDQAGIGLSSKTHRAFQKAVGLVPGHPRATFLWSLMLTDTGNQGLALKALQEAARLRPHVPDLYQGFAYAGRTAGLLEGAQAALARRKALLPSPAPPSAWTTETTSLYLGDWAAFDQELKELRAHRLDPGVLFYLGYSALLKGRREEALAHMKAGDESRTAGPFQELCRVYRALLEGRKADGLAELRRIDAVRGKLRIPDGELTFKQAEAYALLGDADHAMDCATRAFVQGFSCSRWYEASPFLEKMRTHPRWPMLRRNIRERQAVLEGSFPPSSFGP